jgi:Flp pilus assembly protein TadG
MNRKLRPKGVGQSLVEFALLLPLFVLIVMFIFDIGRAVYYYSVLYNAVREGARSAATRTQADGVANEATLRNLVVDRAYGLDLDTGDVDFAWDAGIVTVNAEYDYQPVTPIVGSFLPAGRLLIAAEATMRIEFSP